MIRFICEQSDLAMNHPFRIGIIVIIHLAASLQAERGWMANVLCNHIATA